MYKRVLLKISGEAMLSKDGSPIDQGFLDFLAGEVAAVFETGVQISIVVGEETFFEESPFPRDPESTGPPETTWECLRR